MTEWRLVEHVEEHAESRKNGGHSALDLPFFIVSEPVYRLCHVAESTEQCRIMKMVLFTEKVGQNCLTFVAVIVPVSAKQVKMCHNLPSFE